MKALLITTAIAFLLSLLSVAGAATKAVVDPGTPLPQYPPRTDAVRRLPPPEVGSINDEVGTNSLTHPERDGRTAGSINDEDGSLGRQQRAAERINRDRVAE